MEKHITKLKNNIEVFYKRNLNTPRCALCFSLSINTPEKSPGVTSLMSRLFTQGTTNRNSEQIANELDAYAIEFGAELSQDFLRFRIICLNEDFAKAIELMTDIVKNSTFDEFDKELAKMTGELVAELDSPRAKVSDAYYRTAFKNHPYGTTATKILENAENITKEDVVNAYDTLLKNSKKIITFVGELPFDEVKSQLDNAFSDIVNDVDIKEFPPVAPLCSNEVVEIIKPDANQAHILKGWLVPSMTAKEYPALLLLNVILGASGLSSRLFLELRDKKGLAYVVRSSYEASNICGNFSIYIATEPKNIDVSMAGFKEEIDKIKTVKVSDEELENAKNNIIGKWEYISETNAQQASLAAFYGVKGFGFEFNEKLRGLVREVTADDIMECANKYFDENSVAAILKP